MPESPADSGNSTRAGTGSGITSASPEAGPGSAVSAGLADAPAPAGSHGPAEAARPLRRDAERNRQRILHAAREAFSERGLEVGLDEIARYAGVGVGTVYRRFPAKQELIEALFVDRMESVAALAEGALRAPDPWSGLSSFMEQMAAMLAGDLGLQQMLTFASYCQDLAACVRRRNAPLLERLVRRAQAAGQLRADIRQTDIPFIVFMLAQATQQARSASPEIWRRYLALILDGLRPGREGTAPLPVPALLPDEMENIIRQAATRNQ